MAFDDIPEDFEQCEPCACGGTIKQLESGVWECDTCDWNSANNARDSGIIGEDNEI